MGSQELSVSWKDHSSVLVAVFEKLLSNKSLVDCTVAAEGQYLRVHKVVLSACSPYFEVLLNEDTDKHPIIILRDVKFEDLKRIIDFVYRGEVKLPEDQLVEFLNVAESLQIKGLGAGSNEASGKRKFTEDLFSKKKVESSKPQKRSRNQLSDSENVVKESVPSTELGSQIDDSDPPWHQSTVPSTAQVPSTVDSQPMPTNVFTTPSKANTQDNFPSSEAKSDQVTVPPEPVLPSSSAVVKVEFSPDDSLGAKDDFTYETINEAFSEDSYVMDSENQAVQPSTSHQYSQLPSTHLPSGSLTADNSLAASQVVEQGHAEGEAVFGGEGFSLAAFPSNSGRETSSVSAAVRTSHLPVQLHREESMRAFHPAVQLADEKESDPEVSHPLSSLLHSPLHITSYQCVVCSKMFENNSKFQRHMRIHTGEKPFVCDVCNKAFRLLHHLTNHKRIHTGEKPYECGVCLTMFRTSAALRNHLLVHTGDQPFLCHVCNRSFRRHTELKVHKCIERSEDT